MIPESHGFSRERMSMTPKQMARMHKKNTNVECAQVKNENDGRLAKNRKKRKVA